MGVYGRTGLARPKKSKVATLRPALEVLAPTGARVRSVGTYLSKLSWARCAGHSESLLHVRGQVRAIARELGGTGQRRVALVDNLAVALFLHRKRGHPLDLLQLCRRLGAIELATVISFVGTGHHPSTILLIDRHTVTNVLEKISLFFVSARMECSVLRILTALCYNGVDLWEKQRLVAEVVVAALFIVPIQCSATPHHQEPAERGKMSV